VEGMLKLIITPFVQIKAIAIERNPIDVDEDDEQTHKTFQG